jgi:hypothetical protein
MNPGVPRADGKLFVNIILCVLCAFAVNGFLYVSAVSFVVSRHAAPA